MHGDLKRLTNDLLPVFQQWTSDDLLLIAGDFGFLFDSEETAQERYALDLIESLPFSIAFIDGNHENFPCISSFPLVPFCHDCAHQIRTNLFHLLRGTIYSFACGETSARVLCMGGAVSVDRLARKQGLNWWEDEIPNAAERAKCLRMSHFPFDYILTHAAPARILLSLGISHPDAYSQWLDDILASRPYQKWYFGHLHMDHTFGNITCLFRSIRDLATGAVIGKPF